ncbi:hypothetical protein [Amycolatopsis tucumanensis]|uniref:hypothetical protein n=1 Tax=Amycolatopsis tucumanensis TaxID=401106 RepID=UPI001F377BC0|nr:hypothetical protein [Amycolatopsis tucumanensis]MCF6423354.1 hypothetical protein [Amycolatopsis tucumanensis]
MTYTLIDEGKISKHVHIMPTDTLEWRSAEYDIDPNDRDTLMDIALTEPFLKAEDYADGIHLYDGLSDVATAKAAHLSRCALGKLRHRLSTRIKDGPCLRLRDESPINLEVLEIKRRHVGAQRKWRASLRQRTSADVEASRVQVWRMSERRLAADDLA